MITALVLLLAASPVIVGEVCDLNTNQCEVRVMCPDGSMHSIEGTMDDHPKVLTFVCPEPVLNKKPKQKRVTFTKD